MKSFILLEFSVNFSIFINEDSNEFSPFRSEFPIIIPVACIPSDLEVITILEILVKKNVLVKDIKFFEENLFILKKLQENLF
jgi:hypothetical protein